MHKEPKLLGLLTSFCSAIIPLIAFAQAPAEAQFARQFLDALQPRSIAEKREYCGYFGYDPSGKFVATRATRGTLDGCLAAEPPHDLDLVASYHTHANYEPEHDSEVPSADDVLGDQEEGVDGYVSTPGGRVWFIDGERAIAHQVCAIGCVTADPRFRAETDPDWTVPPRLTLDDIYDRSE